MTATTDQSTRASHPAGADHSTDTRMAQRQTGRLQRTLGRFDIVFLIFSAVVGLEMLG